MIRLLQINQADTAGINKLLEELGDKPGLTLSQLEMMSQLNVRESFKQTASNLAKVLRKQWPGLSHLIQEKSRRKSSNVSGNDSTEGNGGL